MTATFRAIKSPFVVIHLSRFVSRAARVRGAHQRYVAHSVFDARKKGRRRALVNLHVDGGVFCAEDFEHVAQNARGERRGDRDVERARLARIGGVRV